jgi:hypothetical protein
MKKSKTPNEITILFERVLTLELTISAIFDELVESKVINTKNVDKKIQKNLEILNKQVKELNSISKKMDSMNMFMSDTIGEA